MKLNDIYNVKVQSVDSIGNAIARINNFVVFIDGALENEEVKIEIIEINKHFAKAKILEIIKKSENRIIPECKYYNLCGGCSFMHTTYENEMNIKLNEIKRAFNHEVNVLNNKNIYNYRNKVVLHVLKGKLGYFNAETHDLCEIDSCMLLDEKINLKISEIKKYDLNGINEIMIRSVNNQIMINIIGDIKDKNIFNISCDSLYYNNEKIKGKDYLIDEVNNYKFSIYPLSFYQINKEGMINIYNKALEYTSKSNNLIDLYCGTGTIGIWLNKNFKNITGIEINKDAILNANINKKLNNLNNINFICEDSLFGNKLINDNDTLVVDPPRAGLSKKLIEVLNNTNLEKIIYISCNYKTLKRDILLLNNYNLIDLSICSMFPRTKHIECVCLLIKK